MITTEELIARQEIYDVLVAYATACGSRDWESYRRCFTPDARIDYTSAGGPAGSVDDVVAWLDPTLSVFDLTAFAVANVAYTFDGPDRCRVRSQFSSVMRLPGTDGAAPTYVRAGGHYDDDMVRAGDGWALAARTERFGFAQM
jgi:hypothetical protein